MKTTPFAVYRASAGTGKTYTLVKEFLKLLLKDPSVYRNILAITFTNKAAAEMKERIINALHGIVETPDSPKIIGLLNALSEETELTKEELCQRANFALINILHDYSYFSVSTIDSFTHKIVRSFARELHFQPEFEIELDQDFFTDKTIDTILSQIGKNQEITDVLVKFLLHELEIGHIGSIEHSLRKFSNEIWKEESFQAGQLLKDLTIKDIMAVRFTLETSIQTLLNEVKEIAKKTDELIENGKWIEILLNGQNGIGGYFKKFLKEKLPKIDTIFDSKNVNKTIEGDCWESGGNRKKGKIIPEDLKETILEAYDAIIKKMKKHTLYQLIIKYLHSVALFNEIQHQIDDLYDETGKVAIAEFNRRIAEILHDEPAPFIYERVGNRFEHFFIDEFQDTSDLQWNNLSPLVANSVDSQQFSMIVGDGKQAIYRWRNGKVELFEHLSKLEEATQAEMAWDRPYLQRTKVVNLKNNYRSFPQIVEFNNSLFQFVSEHFLNETWQNVYVDQAIVSAKSTDQEGFVDIFWVNGGEEAPEPEDDDRQEENTTEDLAKDEENDDSEIIEDSAFSKISEIIETAENQGFKRGDIAILCRDKDTISNIANYLTDQGIAISSSESLLINRHPDVQLLCSVLRYIVDNQQISDKIFATRWVILRQCRGKEEEKEAMADSVFREVLTMTIDEWEIWLQEQGFRPNFKRILTLPIVDAMKQLIVDFRLNINNLYIRFFLDSLMEETQKEPMTLFGFQDWWEQKGEKLSVTSSDQPNAVKIMTIHKSKGLEFPIVVLALLKTSEKKDKGNRWVTAEQFDPEGELGLPAALIPINNSLKNTKLAEIYEKEEEMIKLDAANLLYVACTRPEQALFIIADKKGTNGCTRMVKMLNDYVIEKGFPDEIVREKTFGTMPFCRKADLPTDEPSEDLENEWVRFRPWQEKIQRVRQKNPSYSFFESREMKYGNLIHHSLEKIVTAEDIPASVHHLVQTGQLSPDDQEAVTQRLTSIVSHPQLAPYFSSTAQVLNENDILFPKNRSTLRPDRIVIIDGRTTIIDYKTGKQRPEHQRQVKKYGNILRMMGYDVTAEMLVYVGGDEIEVLEV